MEKYYTPNLEEFHVGFEYELFNTTTNNTEDFWEKLTFDGFGKTPVALQKLGFGKVRVKYLDREDILSIGAIYIDNDTFKFIKTYRGLSTGDDAKMFIFFEDNDKYLEIYLRTNDGREETLFKGIVKNKSKLVEILKMVDPENL